MTAGWLTPEALKQTTISESFGSIQTDAAKDTETVSWIKHRHARGWRLQDLRLGVRQGKGRD
eukprot:2194751-Pleurochrysis_carterae.AAC.1